VVPASHHSWSVGRLEEDLIEKLNSCNLEQEVGFTDISTDFHIQGYCTSSTETMQSGLVKKICRSDWRIGHGAWSLFIPQCFCACHLWAEVRIRSIRSLKPCSKNKNETIGCDQNASEDYCSTLSSKAFKVDVKTEECDVQTKSTHFTNFWGKNVKGGKMHCHELQRQQSVTDCCFQESIFFISTQFSQRLATFRPLVLLIRVMLKWRLVW
jgi:hypothetical protein